MLDVQATSLAHFCRHDDAFTPLRISNADHGALTNVRVLAKHVFDLESRDLVSAALDDIAAFSSKDSIVAVFDCGHITRTKPSQVECCVGRIGVVPIFEKHTRTLHLDLPLTSGIDHVAIIVNESHLNARQGNPNVSGQTLLVELV